MDICLYIIKTAYFFLKSVFYYESRGVLSQEARMAEEK